MASEWEQREGESGKAYSAFVSYLKLGDRSLAKLAEKLGKSSGYTRQLQTWSSLYEWVRRTEAWDANIAAEALKEAQADLVEQQAKIKKRELELSHELFDRAKAISALPLTRRTLIDTETRPDGTVVNHYTVEPINVSARDAARVADTGSKLGRLATGMTTDTQRREHTGKDGEPLQAGSPLDLSGLDDDELELFQSLLRKAANAGRRPGGAEPQPA